MKTGERGNGSRRGVVSQVLLGFSSIVEDEEVADSSIVPEVSFGKGKGFSHQTRHALAQREIEAFDVVGLSFLFAAGTMLILGNDLSIGLPKIGEARSGFISRGDFVPQLAQGR